MIKNFNRLRIVLFLIVVLTSVYSFAQTKQHYVLHSTNPNVDLTVYYNAIENWGKLDQFRLLDERRTIPFFDVMGNEGVTIEIFSALELKQSYGTEIPKTIITDKNSIKTTVFILTPDRLSIKFKSDK